MIDFNLLRTWRSSPSLNPERFSHMNTQPLLPNGKYNILRWAGLALFVLFLVLEGIGIGLMFMFQDTPYRPGPPGLDALIGVISLAIWSVAGMLIVSRQPTNTIGWNFAILPLLFALDDFAYGYAYYGSVTSPGALPGVQIFMMWMHWTGRAIALICVILLFSLFPTGRPLSSSWARFIRLAAWIVPVFMVSAAITPLPIIRTPFPSDLLGLGDQIMAMFLPLTWATYFSLVLAAITSVVSLAIRFRQARGVERQQVKWFAYAAALFVPGILLLITALSAEFPLASQIFFIAVIFVNLSIAGLAIASAVAVLRYRLWDIDIIIRRTVVYGLQTGILLLVYYASVIFLQQLALGLTGQQSPLTIVLSTLLIAALFSPVRARIQDFIDLRFFRRQYNAERAQMDFAAVVRAEVDLQRLSSALLLVVNETMHPDCISLHLIAVEKRSRQ